MRKDFLLLNQQIKDAYVDYIKKYKRIPTQIQVAEICGVSQVTVSKHFTKINLNDLIQPFKIYGDDVPMGLRAKAVKGDAQAAKLFFMLVYDWNEKKEVALSGKDGNALKVQFEFVDGEDRE